MMEVKYRTTFNIAWQKEPTQDFVFIKDYVSEEFVILEDISKDIWMGLIHGLSTHAICKQIESEYSGTNFEAITQDVDEFISMCEANGWIESCV